MPTERRNLVLVALATLIPFTVLAIWATSPSQAAWEVAAIDALHAPPEPIAVAVIALNFTGNLPIWAIVIAIASVITGAIRGIAAGLLVALSFASDAAAFGVKIVVERDRPDTAAVEQFFGVDNFSYPSGHAVRAAALVAVLVWLFAPARYRLPLALIAGTAAGTAMGFARVSLGVHWPTDAVGGTLLGLGWFALTAALVWIEPFRKVDGTTAAP